MLGDASDQENHSKRRETCQTHDPDGSAEDLHLLADITPCGVVLSAVAQAKISQPQNAVGRGYESEKGEV